MKNSLYESIKVCVHTQCLAQVKTPAGHASFITYTHVNTLSDTTTWIAITCITLYGQDAR